MVKTQVQLPDDMYRAVKALAERKEWSLAEAVRRALEAMLARFPRADAPAATPWELPPASPLGGDGFFANPDWRYELNAGRGTVRETGSRHPARKKAKRT